MKLHTVILCSMLATGAASAHAADFDAPLSVQSPAGPGKSRAEVRAETLRALTAGEVAFGDVGFPRTSVGADAPGVGRSRADVKAETRQALAAHEITFGDAAYPKPATPDGVGLTRTAVKTELLRSIAAHDYHFDDTAYPDSGIVTTPRTKVHAKAVAASPAAGLPAS